MLNEEHGHVPLPSDPLDVVEHAHRLLLDQAGAGLVEQDRLGATDEGQGQVDGALGAVGHPVACHKRTGQRRRALRWQ